MPLTPQAVRDKLFTSVRFKQGYHEGEVDAFLDEVEAELVRLTAENERLRAELAQAREVTEPAGADAEEGSSDGSDSDLRADRLPPPSPTEHELRRTLLLAQRTADAAVAEANAEAEAIRTAASAEAAEAERVSRLERQASQQAMQAERDRMQAAIEQLQRFEREHRGRLKAYLHLQLRELEASAPEDQLPAPHAPGQLAGPYAQLGLPSGAEGGAGSDATPDGSRFSADPGPAPVEWHHNGWAETTHADTSDAPRSPHDGSPAAPADQHPDSHR